MTAFLEHAGQPALNSVSGAMIQVWVEGLAAALAPSSVARKLASLKSLLTFGHARPGLSAGASLARQIRRPK